MRSKSGPALACLALIACGESERSTDEGIISVVSFSPEGKVTRTRAIEVRFSAPVVDAADVGSPVEESPLLSITPALSGEPRWVARDRLEFVPAEELRPSTQYHVRILPGAIGGRRLADPREHRFFTEMFGLASAEASFEAGPRGRDGRVTLELTHAAAPGAVEGAVSFLDARGRPLSARLLTRTPGRVFTFALAPTAGPDVEVHIAGELSPLGEGHPIGKNIIRRLVAGGEAALEIDSVRPTQAGTRLGIHVRFNRNVDAFTLEQALTVSPEVKTELIETYHGVTIMGAFAPRTTYRIKIDRGLHARSGPALREPFTAKIEMPDFSSAVRFTSPGVAVLESGRRRIDVETTNVSRLVVEVTKVFEDNLVHVTSRPPGSNLPNFDTMGRVVHEAAIDVPHEENEVVRTAISLDALEASGRHGVHLVRVWDADHHWVEAKRWLLLSDLGVTAKVGSDYVFVEVISRVDLTPVPGAKVKLLSKTNAVLAALRTDARGRATARVDLSSHEQASLALVVVERGADFAYLPISDRTAVPALVDEGEGAREKGGDHEAYVYTDRPVYRPGDVVHATAILRDRSLATPPPLPIQLELRDPRAGGVAVLRGTAAKDGAETFDVSIPSDAVAGAWTLRATVQEEVVGEARFHVEATAPDPIAVEVTPTSHAASSLASPIGFRVRARHSFGPPASGLDVELTCVFEERPFTAPAFSSFRFGAVDEGAPLFERRRLGRFSLDADGKIERACEMEERSAPEGPVRVTMEARVSQRGGRSVSGVGRVTLHSKNHYLGIRRDSERPYVEEGTDAGLQVVVVDPDGHAVPNVPLVATVFEVTQRSVLRRVNGRTRSISHREKTKIDELAVRSGPEPVALPYTPGSAGRFVVEVETSRQAGASYELWTRGVGRDGSAVGPQDRLRLTPDRAGYDVGDTAEVSILAPTSEGKLLLSVERDRVIWQGSVDLRQGTATVRIPILESMSPNAYLAAQLVTRPGTDGAARAFGVMPLEVRSERHALTVQMEAPAQVSPEQKLRVRVRAEGGRRLPHFTVAAVAEGASPDTDFQGPDPFGFFTRRRGLGLTTYDLYGLRLRSLGPTEGRPAAGRPAEAGDAWSDQAAAPVLWSGIVAAESDGWATVELDVPAVSGALRVMAVAFAGDRFGAATDRVQVSDPVVLVPSLPRFAGTLDQLRIPVRLANTTTRATDVQVEVGTEGRLRVSSSNSRTVALAAGAERTVAFDVEADEVPGPATLRFEAATSGWESVRTAALEVRAPGRMRRHVEHGVAKHDVTPAFQLPSDWVASSIQARIEVGGTQAFQYGEALAFLLRYPYPGLEPIISSAFPLLYLSDLRSAVVKGQPQEGTSAGDDIRTAIARVLGAMAPSGALAFWPGGRAHPWITVYGAHFLVEARRTGRPVDRERLDRLLRHLGGIGGGTAVDGYPEGVDFRTQVYALYVAALAGRANERALQAVAERFERALSSDEEPDIPIDNEVRALIAGGLLHAGLRSRAAPLLSGRLVATPRTPRSGFFSATRADALALCVLAEVQPGHPSLSTLTDVVLSRAVDGRWATTQENAYALLALGKLGRGRSDAPAYWGSVLVGGDVLKRFNSGGPFVLSNGGADWAGKQITVTVTGAGKAHVALRAGGLATSTLAPPSSDGLEVSRILHRPDGSKLQGGTERGSLVVTAVHVKAVRAVDYVAVVDRLPAGLEIESPRLSPQADGLDWLKEQREADFTDVRDDRIMFFTDLAAGEERTFYYASRAVTEGRFVLPHVEAEAIYDPSVSARAGGGRFEVRPPDE